MRLGKKKKDARMNARINKHDRRLLFFSFFLSPGAKRFKGGRDGGISKRTSRVNLPI